MLLIPVPVQVPMMSRRPDSEAGITAIPASLLACIVPRKGEVWAPNPSLPHPGQHMRPFRFRLLLTVTTLLATTGIGLASNAGAQQSPAPPAAPAAVPLQGIEAFVAEGMERWGIPGLAVAVVKDDSVVYAQGFGALGLEDRRPVDAGTLFGIASVSKGFTAAALGMLVDEGVLHWDDPVIRHLPDFRLYDPWVTEHVTIRDLLAHRVGVGRLTGNRLRWLPSRPRSELLYRVRYAGPEQPFRNGYVYSNVMYTVAGEIIPAVTGLSWDEFIETRLFPALGMPASNTSITRIADGSNAALPHQEIDREVIPIPRRNFDAAGPSAAINTSVDQLTQWMRLHLGEPGVLDGERILSAAVVREMHRAQNRIPDGGPPGNLSSYGLGFSLGYHDGVRISTHGGATDGMNSTLLLAPELNLGVVVLTNTFNTFTNSLANRVLDRYMGIDDRDWIGIHHGATSGSMQRHRRSEIGSTRRVRQARRRRCRLTHTPDCIWTHSTPTRV